MKHARKRSALRRSALPVLLSATCAVGFGGLTALADSPTQAALAFTAPPPAPLLDEFQLERERAAARATRSRRIAEARAAAQAAAEAEAAARAKAEADAAAAAAAAAKAEAEAKAKAEAAAAAAAAKAAAKAAAQAAPQRATAAGGGACPVPNASFTDTWGAPRSGGRAHKGTDLLAPYGSPVYAVVSGRIRQASSAFGGISLYLVGDNGETYFYAHNSANVAATGQRVAAGDLIAKVGSTGNAGGTNHVHFEREVGGRVVNSYDFVRRLC